MCRDTQNEKQCIGVSEKLGSYVKWRPQNWISEILKKLKSQKIVVEKIHVTWINRKKGSQPIWSWISFQMPQAEEKYIHICTQMHACLGWVMFSKENQRRNFWVSFFRNHQWHNVCIMCDGEMIHQIISRIWLDISRTTAPVVPHKNPTFTAFPISIHKMTGKSPGIY
jgi:hypothetical protein